MARIVGTSGRDVLRGTSHRDVIIGKGGNDKIIGRGGNDKLKGGKGNDTIKGNGGNDKLIGGKGKDKLIGGNGNDKLNGGAGNDKLDAGKGDDTLNGGSGNDLIDGGPGADDLFGGSGADIFKFEAGDGFHTSFPASSPPEEDIFDDVINDFSGFRDPESGAPGAGQGDKLDVPVFDSFTFGAHGVGLDFVYEDADSNPVGSFLLANTQSYDITDFI